VGEERVCETASERVNDSDTHLDRVTYKGTLKHTKEKVKTCSVSYGIVDANGEYNSQLGHVDSQSTADEFTWIRDAVGS